MKRSDSLMNCSACKIRKSLQRPQVKSADHDRVTEPLQVVTTALMGPISPTTLGNSSYVVKFADL